jgi:predicted nucleic acid-binding protein
VLDDEAATCVPVALEYLHNARDGAEYEDDREDLAGLHWLPLTRGAADRALELQRILAHTTHGTHRLPPVDYLVTAVAAAAGATLWHVDRHLHRLCELAGIDDEHEQIR